MLLASGASVDRENCRGARGARPGHASNAKRLISEAKELGFSQVAQILEEARKKQTKVNKLSFEARHEKAKKEQPIANKSIFEAPREEARIKRTKSNQSIIFGAGGARREEAKKKRAKTNRSTFEAVHEEAIKEQAKANNSVLEARHEEASTFGIAFDFGELKKPSPGQRLGPFGRRIF